MILSFLVKTVVLPYGKPIIIGTKLQKGFNNRFWLALMSPPLLLFQDFMSGFGIFCNTDFVYDLQFLER
jgi:hypothetical protein